MKQILFLCFLCLLQAPLYSQIAEKLGIGVRLQIDSTRGYNITKVIGLIPDGSAQAGGIKEGDFILKVNATSTRDMELSDVVDMIIGDEGTSVKLEINRNGSLLPFTLIRKKYHYAELFYRTALPDDIFCVAMTKLMNDAPYDFIHTKDSTKFTSDEGAWSRKHYESKVSVPGAVKTEMIESFGITCSVIIGDFKNSDDANAAGEKLYGQLKACFPDFYFHSVTEEKGNKTIQIGEKSETGFHSAILEILSTPDDEKHEYKIYLRINGGKLTAYVTTTSAPLDNEFGNGIRKIYDDILSEYSHVKGTPHQNSGLFSSTTYEITPKPPGAHDCSFTAGGMSLGNGCVCRFFYGEDHDAAVTAFDKVSEAMIESLGSDFVTSTEAPQLDITVPKNAEKVIMFGKKKRRSYESCPLIALVLAKGTGNLYGVNMIFHKFGF